MPTQTPKRPSKVKVLTVTYSIFWLNEDEWYAGHLPDESIGVTERDRGTIIMRADPKSNEDSLRSTLTHEIMHACTQASRVEKELGNVSDGEEFFISIIAPLFLLVMTENPAVAKYLFNLQ